MKVTHGSNVGLVRANNEDNYICIEPDVFAVADGMGGHAGGEVASKLLIDEVKKSVQGCRDCNQVILQQIIQKANNEILAKAADNTALNGMGTTASIIFIDDADVTWAHIGDSRIYLLHDDKLTQITTDHSLVEMWVENGTITQEEAQFHPQKNILTRAVGVNTEIEIDTGRFSCVNKDIILLATDGLTNMVNNDKIKQILLDTGIENKADCLIGEAVKNGGIDNITAIVVEI
ncbi:Stp1/IreP family PP2C-type Ser/Thr phosphatase [Pectinatus brassicae]|uniref:Protein phosphatase n=1 Tax=Pectinatus brassicae TaxID=862415 RepID=A0A840UH64_9FIRM|nr:Stp1/IreP family PP2C-type Ser/Thr phosphatase [Pectinatus brassicae]MBB5335530.1 protein phosphatase [Pectinatus brassicae]